MADDRLELRCFHCNATHVLAVLHGSQYRAFSEDADRLREFITTHIGCRNSPPVLRFGTSGFLVTTENDEGEGDDE